MRSWTFAPVFAFGLSWASGLVSPAGAPRARPDQAPTGRYHESIAGTLVTFEMIRVAGGSNVAEFFIGRTEVTWDMFDVFMLRLDAPRSPLSDDKADAIARPSEPYGAPDRGWGHAGFPAMSVTHGAAEAFCEWLSAKTGKPYRLPTDAEWSRAASLAAGRAGALDTIAWHRANSNGQSHPVGRRAEDALGLVDLFGNVAEWVTTGPNQFVTRGGSYRDAAVGPDARAAQDPTWNQTDPQLPKSRWWLSDGPFVGFRLAAPSRGGPS